VFNKLSHDSIFIEGIFMNRILMLSKLHFSKVMIFGGIISLFAIAGCGNTTAAAKPTATLAPTATTAPTATPTSAVNTLYTSTTGTYSIDYPGSWTAQPITSSATPGGVAFSPAGNGDALAVSPLTAKVPTTGYAQVAKGFLSGLKATNVKLDSSTSTASLPSGTWTTLDGTMTVSSASYMFSELGIDHGGVTFFIYVIAPTATAQSDATTYFEPMLESFKFLK
jgi:hypothetical protein